MSVVLNINTDKTYNQRQRYTLDGKVLIVHTYWNLRQGWFIGLYDIDDNPLIEGIQMMPNSDLLKRHRYLEVLDGLLTCADTDPEKADVDEGITFENFGEGKRWQLMYFTQQELLDLST